MVPILAFLSITAGVVALASFLTSARDRVGERVRGLSGAEPRKAEPGLISRLFVQGFTRVATPVFTPNSQRRDQLSLRLTQAGYDGEHAIAAFHAVRTALVVVPLVAAGVVGVTGVLSPKAAAVAGGVLSTVGMIAPGIWLGSKKKKHQNELRRGLPDFFDVLVLCVEGGMSLLAAWRRVADELRLPYGTLWKELKMVEQEVEIGRPMSEALQRCAERTDLDEVASLASVVRQAERVGTELAQPMRELSNTLRSQRVQRAEEAAHKTATKIMFPTLLFIFPGVFAILLGPMIIQVLTIFSGGKK